MLKNTIFASALAVAGTALAFSGATPANALTFSWSFLIDGGASFPVEDGGKTISGTINGLVEGFNSGAGLTVTVDSTPSGAFTGGGWTFNSGTGFTVTGGVITAFEAIYTRGDATLEFGTEDGTFSPSLTDTFDADPDWRSIGVTTFAEAPLIPEPGSVVALLGLGALGVAGRKLKG